MTLVDLYRRSVESFADRVKEIRPDQWTAATPCTDWDVRALVNHVVYEQRWSVPLLAGATIAEVGDRFEGDVLGNDPVANSDEAAEAARAAAVETGAMERTVHLSFGDTPATEYVNQLFADHLIHGWDLATAIGADQTIDPESLQACREWFADREDAYRSSGAIGPRVDLPDGATEQDRLLSAFGRAPNPR